MTNRCLLSAGNYVLRTGVTLLFNQKYPDSTVRVSGKIRLTIEDSTRTKASNDRGDGIPDIDSQRSLQSYSLALEQNGRAPRVLYRGLS